MKCKFLIRCLVRRRKREKDCNGPSTYGGSLSDFLVERELLMEVKQYFHSQM